MILLVHCSGHRICIVCIAHRRFILRMPVLEEKRRGDHTSVQPSGCRAAVLLFLAFILGFTSGGLPKVAFAGTNISEPPDYLPATGGKEVTTKKISRANTPKHSRLVRWIEVLDPTDCSSATALTNAGLTMNWPASDTSLTQPFTWQHAGLDLAADPGAMATAAHDGQVIFAGWSAEGYGYLVTILHAPVIITTPVTTEVRLKTHYAHLKQIVVAEGAQVKAGQVIGQIGSTGYASGPHLHFEVRLDSVAVNPLCFWPRTD